jgi:ABC-type lipoprotein release transport system permease subunit
MVLGIDPIKERNLSNPEERLVHFRITDEAIAKVQRKELPQEIVENLKKLRNNSYSSAGRIQTDLKLSETDAIKFQPFITEACAFKGNTIISGDDGVLISDRLSKFLKIYVGDTLILLGQGYHGVSAAGLYPVRGVVYIPSPELDNKLVFMPLQKAQEFFSLNQRLTSIAINPYDNSDKGLKIIQSKISTQINQNKLIVRDWKEFNKVLLQQIQGDSQTGQIILGLLYFLVFFGIFGTVLMMIHERLRESGVLIAIGMQRSKLAIIMIIEMLFMGLLGVVSGTALSLPILYIGNVHPIRFTGDLARIYEDMGFEAIMPLAWIDAYVFWQALVVALMVVLSCIYPLRKVYKLKEVDALRA